MLSHRNITRIALATLCLLAAPLALAQAYPAKPVKLIVPFPPGGPTDIVGRFVATKLSEALGQQFVVENRAGAGGTVGSEVASQAPADGYTLLYGSTSTLAMAPSLYRKLAYDPRKSFAPISLVSSGPMLVAVNASVPANTLAELIALAKDKPGSLNYASAGNATPPHLAAEMFKSMAGVNLVHVPYKGGGPALQAVTAGEVQILFEGLVTLLPQIKSGRLRALAISAAVRDPALPDVPTSAEAGLPAFQVNFWSGLVAPAGTPPEVVATLNAALRHALGHEATRQALVGAGFEPAGSSVEQFAQLVERDRGALGRVVRAGGMAVN